MGYAVFLVSVVIFWLPGLDAVFGSFNLMSAKLAHHFKNQTKRWHDPVLNLHKLGKCKREPFFRSRCAVKKNTKKTHILVNIKMNHHL